jgi:tripeptide aminopeptidase
VRVAGESERRELNDLFEALCRIESPSGRERECAQRIGEELRALGLEVSEDDAAASVGGDCGNLLARLPARSSNGDDQQRDPARTVLLCAHMDTVPLGAPLEPVVVDDGWENAGEGILGADNKAAVAVILAVARHAAREGLPVDLELLFTVSEERALAGARAFDRSQLRCDFGYVFDHATPIGELIVASPSQYRVEATFRGAAAHAGMHPEKGRSAIVAAARAVTAMRLGRLDEQTTANVGEIAGGTAMNVVPERCTLVGEARSLSDEKLDAVVSEMVDHIHDAANLPECECDVDVGVQRMFQGYRVSPSAPAVAAAERALERCGYQPRLIASGGAADANVFQVQGLSVINVANGTERAHEPTERVSVQALEGMLDVALTLVDEAAR